METSEKPITAAELFTKYFSDEKLVTLSNGLKFLIQKVDIHEIMTAGQMGLPVVTVKVDTPEDLKKIPEADLAKIKINGRQVLDRLLIAGCRSPKFVDGPTDIDKNEISLTDSRIPSGLKTELNGHIYDFNGYTETAREFFRLVSPGQLDGAGPPGQEIRSEAESAAQI